MEDAMCYGRNYRIFDRRQKAEDTQVRQEREARVIDQMLDDAKKHAEKAREAAPVKEMAPAK
jgi:hypothetical protein